MLVCNKLVPIFGDIVPRCCVKRVAMKWKYYYYWGHYHEDGDNTCINCGMPAYQRFDHGYNGFLGFCTQCNATWVES